MFYETYIVPLIGAALGAILAYAVLRALKKTR